MKPHSTGSHVTSTRYDHDTEPMNLLTPYMEFLWAKQQIPISYSLVLPAWGSNPWSTGSLCDRPNAWTHDLPIRCLTDLIHMNPWSTDVVNNNNNIETCWWTEEICRHLNSGNGVWIHNSCNYRAFDIPLMAICQRSHSGQSYNNHLKTDCQNVNFSRTSFP